MDKRFQRLTEETLVIADEKSAIAIAGVIGGMGTATLEDSSEILLESAFFDPIAISGVARSYGLHTEASLRLREELTLILLDKQWKEQLS